MGKQEKKKRKTRVAPAGENEKNSANILSETSTQPYSVQE